MNKKSEKIQNNIEIKSDIKNVILNNNINPSMETIVRKKIRNIQEIIQNTIISIQLYKKHNIYNSSDVILCLTTLNEIYIKTKTLYNLNISNESEDINIDNLIIQLQHIVDKISVIISNFGSNKIEDVLFIIFGSEFINKMNLGNTPEIQDKYELIKRFVHPINYKIINWKQTNKQKAIDRSLQSNNSLCSNKINDDTLIIELANNLECFNVDQTIKSYYIKVNCIRIVIHNDKAQKTVIIHGICDDIDIDCISNLYIDSRLKQIHESITQYNISNLIHISNGTILDILKRIIESLTIKDLLIYGNDDIYKKIMIINSDIDMVLNNKIDIVIKTFIEMDMYTQRMFLINMLTYNKNDEVQYIAYLLYDLITTNPSGQIDSNEQIVLYDSFPFKVKMYFKEAMKYTITYSQNMIKKYDTNTVTLEQKIYLLKVPENVKEKAMSKFKELKSKSDDSGSKAKQYLEGLIKIPFGTYRHEPLLKIIQNINNDFIKTIEISNKLSFLQSTDQSNTTSLITKTKYTNIEMLKYSNAILNNINGNTIKNYIENNNNNIPLKNIIDACNYINIFIKNQTNSNNELIKGKTKINKFKNIIKYLTNANQQHLPITHMCHIYDILYSNTYSIEKIIKEYTKIQDSIKMVETAMDQVIDTLDISIYGHNHAKNQILKVISQWINGEQTGYCFGFEGSPGIGKTSLAKKGLSYCLKDVNGQSRPFAFIALGGSCNGSTLEGHSYTYVNSIWGRIVDILMETKCMNPIIYIDELDKVSKTEHGKEIIGILTHMIDSTQNDSFQDKYFSGIDIDLSKILFVFSYNDPEQIDQILLDRIHRIKFDNLSINDKIVVVKQFIIPEIHKKMGLCSKSVHITDEIIEYIIEYYTMEPGIRKLKEILFDIYGEINIELLKCKDYETIQFPIEITEEILKTKYLKKYSHINKTMINSYSEIGVINGLWANSLGKGGIIQIETVFFPSATFLDLKLTGLQGEVMKESMNVAKSLAWLLTPDNRKIELIEYFEKTRNNGIHIHCPDGAVSKDGPSAGAAITTAIYSLLNNKLINNTFAMTGEIDLRGNITAIGGLESKILGGIRAGVKTFLFPESNNNDFQEFKTKFISDDKYSDIKFISVNHIKKVLEYFELL